MKKVYVVTNGEEVLMACESRNDAEDLVKLWGKHYAYSVMEVPYITIQENSVAPFYPAYKNKSTDVEPMPFVGKPASVKDVFPKVPMDEVGMI